MFSPVKSFILQACDIHLYVLSLKQMNQFEGLTPEQRRYITDLSKRIHLLESKLVVLQARMVKIDPSLMQKLAKNFKQLNLN